MSNSGNDAIMVERSEVPPIFSGYPSGTTVITEIPEAFFTDLFPQIDDLVEMKITLYAFWYIQQLDGDIRYIKLSDIQKDEALQRALTIDSHHQDHQKVLMDALDKAVTRGSLLVIISKAGNDRFYLINTPRSRALVDGYQKGTWEPETIPQLPVGLDLNKPDIYKLYEQNIGLITPLIAEQLKTAAEDFPMEWIEDAIKAAVDNNVRRWSYINRILVSWKERGRYGKN